MIKKFTYKRDYFYATLALFIMLNVGLLAMQLMADSVYMSDTLAHVNEKKGYSLFNQLISLFRHISPNALYIQVMILLASANLCSIIVYNQYLTKRFPNASRMKIDFLSIALFLVSMIIPFFNNFWYYGIGTSNVWHNATYTLCRPFVLLALFQFFSLHEYKEKFDIKKYIFFVIFVTLSTYAKPSFAVVFVPALAVVLSYELIKTKFKSKNIWIFSISIAVAFLPSLFIILYQNSRLFDESSKLVFLWGGAWKHCLPKGGLLVAITFATAFPIYSIATNLKNLKFRHILMILVYIFSFLLYWLVAEDGPRFYHGNMGWSYLFGILLMFITAIELFFFNPNKSKNKILTGGGYLLFALHLISGIIYFGKILSGASFL